MLLVWTGRSGVVEGRRFMNVIESTKKWKIRPHAASKTIFSAIAPMKLLVKYPYMSTFKNEATPFHGSSSGHPATLATNLNCYLAPGSNLE